MTQTTAALIPILTLLIAASGALTSSLFDALRVRYPRPASVPAARRERWLLTLLHAPLWSRLSVTVVAAVFALVLSVLLALLTGRPVAPVVDASVAALVSQLWHGVQHLSPVLPVEQPRGVYESITARMDGEA